MPRRMPGCTTPQNPDFRAPFAHLGAQPWRRLHQRLPVGGGGDDGEAGERCHAPHQVVVE